MISNAEITEIIEAVNNEEYTITDALNELAKAAKGEDVRRALYATAYVLNKEGHSGTVDIQARAGIENLTTSVNAEIEDFESDVNASITAIQTTVNNIDTTRRALIIDELWNSSGEGHVDQGLALSESISNYDYLMLYAKQNNALLPAVIFRVSNIVIGTTRILIFGIARQDGLMTLIAETDELLRIQNNIAYSAEKHTSHEIAPSAGGSTGSSAIVSSRFIEVTSVCGVKTL